MSTRTVEVNGLAFTVSPIAPWADSFDVTDGQGARFVIVTLYGNRDVDIIDAIRGKLAEQATARVVDTRYADGAYARQVADESPDSAVLLLPVPADAPIVLTPVADAPDDHATDVAADGFAAAHDAHMHATYVEAWDAVPTDDPGTGDPLSGTHGRTYAESGWVLMQAARDMFGPLSGHCPILLMQATTTDGRPLIHGAMGGVVLTHTDTFDTWHAALTAMRAAIDHTLSAHPYRAQD